MAYTVLERDAVVQTIEQLVDGARQGAGGALFVRGQAGFGKTALLDHACKLAASHARVGVARGDPMEAALAFGFMTQVIEDLGGPTLLAQDMVNPVPDDIRASKFHQALEWIRSVAHGSPVLLAFDDVHWADPDSLALLSYLCRRITAMPVVVVATLRPWPPAAHEVSLRLAEARYARVEHLRPLSAGAAGDLLAARLGCQPPADVATGVYEASGGNPLLVELAALAITESGTWPGSADQGRAVAPSVAAAVVLRRFAHLPEEGLAFARAASVLGRRFRPDVATALAVLDESQAELALESLSRTGLVRRAGVGLAEFTYPLFPQTLYEDLAPLVRDQLHGRAFRLLLQRGLESEAAEHAVRANLTGDRDVVAVLTRAGRASLGAGAVATAVQRLERAVSVAGERPDPAVLLLLGEALMAEDRGDRAVAVYEQVLRQEGLPAGTVADAQRMLGRALFLTGEVLQGERRLEEAVARSRDDDREGSVQALLDLSRAAWLTAGPAGALPPAAQARQAAREADETWQVQADAAWGFIAFIGGDPAGLQATAAAQRGAAANDACVLRDLAWNWGTLRNTGRAAKYAERFDEAEGVFTVMFAQAEKTASPHAIVSLAAHHADTLVRQGRLREARPLASRAVAMADLAPMAAAFAHVVDAGLLLHSGHLQESEHACERAEEAAAARGQWLPLMRVWHLRALRHVHDGRLDQAYALYGRLETETMRLGIAEPCLVPWARRAVAAFVTSGRDVDAERVQAWAEACSRRLPCRWPRIAADAGRASLAESRGDQAAAEVHLRRALTVHAEAGLALEHVETLLQWGAFLRRTGRLVHARRALREALALAEGTGSLWLAGQVEKELAVARGRRSSGQSPDRLTPQEERVAELAAAGRSSREIARHLSLSRRTIETHLRRIYAKLGIHSQRELMARANVLSEMQSSSERES